MSNFVLPFRVLSPGDTYNVETRDDLEYFVSYMQEVLAWLDQEPVMPKITPSVLPPVVPAAVEAPLFSPAHIRIIQMLSEDMTVDQIAKTERVSISSLYYELRVAMYAIGASSTRFGPAATKLLVEAAMQQSGPADWEALARERMAAKAEKEATQ